MDKLFNTDISIEKMAAYLDGNLSIDGMQMVEDAISNNGKLRMFADLSNRIDATNDGYLSMEFELPVELADDNFNLPEVNYLEDYFGTSDIFSEKSNLIFEDDKYEDMQHNNNPLFGKLTAEDIQQQYPDTCAIKAQQLILESHGINVTEDDLVRESVQKGWYDPENEGTSAHDVGNLLIDHGMKVGRFEHATIEDIASELAKGHQVIVGVDSGELWTPGRYESIEDFLNIHGADHALLVSGIQVNPLTAEREVVLTDTGTGEVAHVYTLDQFQDAWDDSNNFMMTAEYFTC